MTKLAWEGKSRVNGEPIMLGVSAEDPARPSQNGKTGAMVQVVAMLRDVHPHEATKTGADEAVCGGCKLRPSVHKKLKMVGEEVSKYPCYVLTHRKGAQWRALKRAEEDLEGAIAAVSGRAVRFGEYGNMSSVSRDAVEALMKAAGKHTLYEHEWRKPENQWLKAYAMASVHSVEERDEANAMGWRTYRTGDELGEGDIWCPFHEYGIQCIKCGLCNGGEGKDIVNPPHK